MTTRREIPRAMALVIVEATVYYAIAVALIASMALSHPSDRFASRWDAECFGWTKVLAGEFIISDLAYGHAYFVIGLAIVRLHPRMPYPRSTVASIIAIFWSCGLDHMVCAITSVEPHYDDAIIVKFSGAVIAYTGMALLTRDLVGLNHNLKQQQRELEDRLKGMANDEAT